VEDGVKTVADYLELSQDMSEGEFVSTFSLPVLIERIGIFPHENGETSLLSGTVLVHEQSDLWESEDEPDDQGIRDARVFLLQKKAGSMGESRFHGAKYISWQGSYQRYCPSRGLSIKITRTSHSHC
jgi:hypothetical protein